MTITKATGGVDQHQFQVTGQAIVLQTIIGKNQVQRLAGQQCLDRTAAIGIDHHGHAATLHDQQRFVTRHFGALAGLDAPWQLRRLGAVPSTDHTYTQAIAPTVFDQPQDQRRLAGAAYGDVTDHHHWHGRLINVALARHEPRAFALHYAAIQRLQRLQ